MSDEPWMVTRDMILCAVPGLKDALSRADLALVPAADVQRLEAVETQSRELVASLVGVLQGALDRRLFGGAAQHVAGVVESALVWLSAPVAVVPAADEPLAPDPTETGACPPECPECDTNHTRVIRPTAYGPSSVDSADPSPSSAPAAGATLSDVEACSCEESEALKDQLTECRRLLRAIHGFAKSITELSVEVP